jgi:hypothetical protein
MKTTLKNSLKTYFYNPVIIFLFIVFYIILYLFSLIKMPVSVNAVTDYIYLIAPQIILLLITSLFFSIFIKSSYLAVKNKFSVKESLKASKYVLGNFFYLIIFVIINLSTLILAKYSGLLLIKIFSQQTTAIIQTAIYSGLFLLISIFFIFQFFYFTTNKSGFFKSIWKSIILAKRNYFKTILIPICYLIITFLLNLIPFSAIQIKDAIYYIVIYPIFTIILSSWFVSLTEDKKSK